MDEAIILARFVHYTAVIVLFGGNAFRVYALGGSPEATRRAITIFDAWLGRITLLGAVVALLSALALLCATAGGMAGSPAAGFDGTTLATVLLETSFGRVWRWRLLLAAALAAACCGRAMRERHELVAASAALLLASLALVGHAAMSGGMTKIGHQLNDGLHLLAAGLWLGGLLPLLWLLRHARGIADPRWRAVARYALPAFSQMGYFAVGALAVTGAVNALLLVGSFGALFATPYGRLLTVKIVLYLAMVGLALGNRFRLAPRILEGSAPVDELVRAVFAEQALGLLVLAVVSVLGTWPPAAGASAM